MPEILKDDRGSIVGVIVKLPFGMYGVSALTNLYGRGGARIVQKSFGRLDDARNWLRKATADTTTDGKITRLPHPVIQRGCLKTTRAGPARVPAPTIRSPDRYSLLPKCTRFLSSLARKSISNLLATLNFFAGGRA